MEASASGGQSDAVLVRIQALGRFPTEFKVDEGVGKRWSAGCRFGLDAGVRMLSDRIPS